MQGTGITKPDHNSAHGDQVSTVVPQQKLTELKEGLNVFHFFISKPLPTTQ